MAAVLVVTKCVKEFKNFKWAMATRSRRELVYVEEFQASYGSMKSIELRLKMMFGSWSKHIWEMKWKVF